MKKISRAIGNALLFMLTPFGITPDGNQSHFSAKTQAIISIGLLMAFVVLLIIALKLMQ